MRATTWQRAITLAATTLSGVLLAACSCNRTPAAGPCTDGIDLDGDRFGVRCPAGPDCDDDDPAIHDECCQNGGIGPGCGCDPVVAQPVSCFDGLPELPGVGPCAKGLRRCDAATGTWGVCDGQVLPQEEACNGADDDCDAQTDEGVASACGNCLPGCADIGVDTEPFPCMEQNPAISCDGVGVNPEGDLILDSSTIENHFLWVANDHEGTVTKIDTRTGWEVARYASVTHTAGKVRNHAGGRPFPFYNAGTANGGYSHNRPSRTSVDFYGNCWVANRAFGYQPSITKFYNDVGDCTDTNGNGLIETSRDVDGNRRIDVAMPGEFYGEDDECIVMTVVVGGNDGLARALTIDAGMQVEGQPNPGNPWVGMYNEQAFYQIDGLTGALKQRVPQAGGFSATFGRGQNSYGAVVDGTGKLWAPSGCCGAAYLAWIDTTMNPAPFGQINAPSAGGSYGITADLDNRIWLGGYPNNAAYRYTPATNTWATASIPAAPGWGIRGVGIDTLGNVWGALHTVSAGNGSRLVRIDADTATVTGLYDVPGQNVPTGAGVDFDGHVWAINQTSSTASRLHIDPITHQPSPHPTTGNVVDTFPTGLHPYT